MKCLIIAFKNAGIFNPAFSKNYVFDLDGLHKRRLFARIDVPIGTLSKRHISNLLHVFQGERPSPSLRSSHIKPIPEIIQLAGKTKVKIHSVGNNKKQYLTEVKNVRKCIPDSWPPTKHNIILAGKLQEMQGGLLTWERLHVFLEDDLFVEFQQLVIKCLGERCLKERVEDVISKLSNVKEVEAFANKCEEQSKTPLARLLKGTTYAAYFYTKPDQRIRLTITKGIEKISKIDGEIFVPVTEKELEKFRNGTGIATFLEGGVAYIKSVEETYSENLLVGAVEPSA
jgi:hypothetical protein